MNTPQTSITDAELDRLVANPDMLIAWAEPMPDEGGGTATSIVAMTVRRAIKQQRKLYSQSKIDGERCKEVLQDSKALLHDFMIVHWACPVKLNNINVKLV